MELWGRLWGPVCLDLFALTFYFIINLVNFCPLLIGQLDDKATVKKRISLNIFS